LFFHSHSSSLAQPFLFLSSHPPFPTQHGTQLISYLHKYHLSHQGQLPLLLSMSETMILKPKASLGQMPNEILLDIASHMPHMTQKCMNGITRTSKRFRLVFLPRYIGQITFIGSMKRISHRLTAFDAVHASSTGPIWSYVR
jgi:hypothetical protein